MNTLLLMINQKKKFETRFYIPTWLPGSNFYTEVEPRLHKHLEYADMESL